MPKTINQHYVPQFLLNNFSLKEKKDKYLISIYTKLDKKYRYDVVENIFSQNYFYDTDNKIEEYLKQKEINTAPIIKQIIANKQFNFIESEINTLLDFICIQFLRTLSKREEMVNAHTNAMMSLVHSMFELNKDTYLFKDIYNNSSKIDYGSYQHSKEDKRAISALSVISSEQKYQTIRDLKFYLLENNTSEEFIIGDDPVILVNWLLSENNLTKNNPVNSSPMALGVQLFIPLSPHLYLCLYDKNVYKYGNKASSISKINLQDVIWLNSLQVIYANRIVGFLSESMKSNIFQLINKYENVKLRATQDKSNIQQINIGWVLKNLYPKPSFFRVLDKGKKLLNGIFIKPSHSNDTYINATDLYRKI